MDTLKDKEVLEDMVEQGSMPWRLGRARRRARQALAGKSDNTAAGGRKG